MQRLTHRFLVGLTLAVAACDGGSGLYGVAQNKSANGGNPGGPDTSVTTPVTPAPPTRPTGPGPVVAVELASDTLALQVGYYGHLSAVGLNALKQLVPGKKALWTTSNPAVAVVSDTGVVAAIAPGQATVTATIDGIAATARVTVFPRNNPPGPPLVASFNVTGTVLGVEQGQDTSRTVRVAGAELTLYRIAPANWSPLYSSSGGSPFDEAPLNELVTTTTSNANGSFTFAALSSAWYRVNVKAPALGAYLDAVAFIAPATSSDVTVSVLLRRKP